MSMRDEQGPSTKATLHHLFLTLFLRGRTSRGLKKKDAPTSIGQKLALVLGMYALMGLVALAFMSQSIFVLSAYLHGMTFAFLGIFLASSAGEVLYNKEEADILLHRPIAPQDLLWAKIRVLLSASLWLAGAFNLVGFYIGFQAPDGGLRFVLAHLISVSMQAIFCASAIVMAYQLCLRWFGRERLDGLITGAQVIVSVFAMLCGQLLPQLMIRADKLGFVQTESWWFSILPPAWFAGFDVVLAGAATPASWVLAAMAILVTALVTWLAFARLAGDFESGMQRLGESVSPKKHGTANRRWINVLVDAPPLCWWLREPVVRASFLLSAAYLLRDRDVKLRVYPALAPIIILPVIMLLPQYGLDDSGIGFFQAAIAYGYLGVLPVMGLNLLQYSQQWQASDVFRATPMAGPQLLCEGAMRAVIVVLALPIMALVGVIVSVMLGDITQIILLIPSLIAMPVLALIPNLVGSGVPLSLPTEEAKGAGRGLVMFGIMFISLPLSGLAAWCWNIGYFHWFLIAELLCAGIVYIAIRRHLVNMTWPALE